MSERPASRSAVFRARIRQMRSGIPFAGGVLAAFAAILLYNWLVPAPVPLTTQAVQQTVAHLMASATPPPALSEQVYRTIHPSLVLIQTSAVGDEGEDGYGLGSGVVVNDRGDILTSLHVVAGARSIELTFTDGSRSSARIVVAQPEHDIAVLRARQPPQQLVPAILGNPNAMRIGDEAFVVGHPLGLYGSMSAGVISGFDRSFQPTTGDRPLHGLIQIDAAVNPGNSGGPLLNRDGHVIGIVAGLVNPTNQEVFIGLGFAVPITVAASGAGFPPY
ncbi:MAG TPA: trypsin-like peptidase domain-containing protein [Herpetosiphonaceae bacterium]